MSFPHPSHAFLRRTLVAPAFILSALVLSLLVLVACGGGDGASSEDSDSHAAGQASSEDSDSHLQGVEGAGAVTGSEGVITVYSGRNEALVGPVLERFTEATGREVEVRYGETAELAATLLEEGDASPADVFISQDAAALGAVAAAGMLRTLPADLVERVPAHFADPEGRWVGLSGRARVVVYNPDRIAEDELPKTLQEVTDPRYKGRFGVAPLNGSFQAHMAVYRAVEGAEALDELLAGMVANEPSRYPKNSAIVEAVLAGEVDFGLVNHYYLWRNLSENPDAPGANYFMPGGGASGFINVAGAGVLTDGEGGVELVRYLLGDEAQAYFAEETFEYPLVDGVEPSVELTPLGELNVAELDFGVVSDELEPTLQAIQQSGLVQ